MTTEFIIKNWYLFVALVVVLGLLLLDPLRQRMSGLRKISPLELPQVTRDGGMVLDVSEPGEFKQSHVPKSKNAPIKQLQSDLGKLEKHKKKPVVVVCRTGNKSLTAAKQLLKNGFNDVYVLNGGMLAWQKENLPVDKG